MINSQPYYPNYQYPQPMPVYQQPVQTQNQVLTWVKDEKEAVNYPLSAGQSIFLMNQSEDYLYAKACDQLGKVTFLKKRLVDESEPRLNTNVNVNEFVRKEELESMIADMIQREVEKKVSEVSFKAAKTRRKASET